jgi:hypothetical protein
VSDQLFVLQVQGADRFDMLIGHEQDVSGRDRVDIPKSGYLFVVKNDRRPDFF